MTGKDQIHIPVEILQLLTMEEAFEYHLVPFRDDKDSMACYGEEKRDYGSMAAEFSVVYGKKLHVKYLPADQFRRLLCQCYRGGDNGRPAIRNASANGGPGFVQALIGEAFRDYASDIHMEPYDGRCRIRFRIDGKLLERYVVEKSVYASLVNQVKIMAGMDISEKRLPQDGRIFYDCNGQKFDLRVSSLPILYGEKIVLRLLTRHVELLELSNLGFTEKQLEVYEKVIHRPHGLVLMSGPTGSGKSTTLYATLRLLNHEDSNILTIEDPVEYTLEGINQVQLKEDIGLTFGEALRTFLRQDPDIIMLGEIRDVDTAQMAIRSSLTGHLIFSTVHTNSAWGCVSRLVDMGVHPYLLADTLLLSVAQRLVRLLCPHCKCEMAGEEVEVLPSELKALQGKYYRAAGCQHCYYTGYSGRKAVYEVIPVDMELAAAIRESVTDISAYLSQQHIPTLYDAAVALVRSGETSPVEVLPLLMKNYK